MFNKRNRDRKSQLSGILTEPLNPRALNPWLIIYDRYSGVLVFISKMLFKLPNSLSAQCVNSSYFLFLNIRMKFFSVTSEK